MYRIYFNVDVNSLVDELLEYELLSSEKMLFLPEQNGLKINFTDISEIERSIYDSETEESTVQVIYKKRLFETVPYYHEVQKEEIIEETNELGEIILKTVLVTSEEVIYKDEEIWEEYNPTELFNTIQSALNKHDNLKRKKELKIKELRNLCDKIIINGFDSTCFDGETSRHYSLTSSDQTNILGSMMKISLGLTPTYKWDDYIGICFEWSAEQMLALSIDMDKHITSTRDKYALLKEQVLNSTSVEEINNIEW